MADFASRLRAKLSSDGNKKKREALDAVAKWIDGELVPNLESTLEHTVEEGKDRVVFRHTFPNGYRIDTADLEKLPEYEFLAARCKLLGLSSVAMSHRRMAGHDDPTVYPCAEIMIFVPPAWRDPNGGSHLAGL